MRSKVLQAIDDSMSDAETLDDVVVLIAEILGSDFPLDRVSIRLCESDDETLLVAAVWSSTETKIAPGVRISKAASSLPEVIEADGPVFVSNAPTDRLLDDVIVAEGYRSWVTIPVRRDAAIQGLLSLSSFTADAFAQSDLERLALVARLIEARVFDLADAHGDRE